MADTDPWGGTNPFLTEADSEPASTSSSLFDNPWGDSNPFIGGDNSEPKSSSLASEAGRGLAAGIQNLKGFGYGIGALAGQVTGIDALKEKSLEGLQQTEKTVQEKYAPTVGSYKDVGGFNDALKYLTYGVATNIPNILMSLASGGAGAYLGKKAAMGAVEGLTEEAAKKIAQKYIKRGAMAGAGLSSIGMETGTIAGDQVMETGAVNPVSAIAGGLVAGALDFIPEWYLMKRLGWFGDEVKGAIGSRVAEIAKGFGKQFAMEAPTEAMQSVVERMSVPGKSISNREAWDEYIDSFILGGLTGGVAGGISGVMTKGQQNQESNTPTQNTLESDPIASDIEKQLAEIDTDGVTKVNIPEEKMGTPVEESVIQAQPEPEITPESSTIQSTPELPPTNLPAPTEIIDSGANGEVGGAKADEQGAEDTFGIIPYPKKSGEGIVLPDGTFVKNRNHIDIYNTKVLSGLSDEQLTVLADQGTKGAAKELGRRNLVPPVNKPEPIVESTPTTPDYESEAKSLGLIYKGRMGNVPGKPDMIHFTDPTNAAGSFSLLDGESLPDKLAKEREKKQKGLTPEQLAGLGKGVENVEKVAEVDQVSKEPWEMTYDEYIEPRFEERRYQGISSGAPSSYVKTHEESVRDKIAQEHDDLIQKAIKEGKPVPVFNKPIWMRTQKEQLEYSQKRMRDAGNPEVDSPTMREADIADHKQEVEFALQDGKPVPESVLKDYPDLIPPTVAKGTQATKEKIAKVKATPTPKSKPIPTPISTTSNPKAVKETVLSQLEPLIIEARNKWREEIGGAGNKLSDKELDERVLSGKFGDNEAKGKVTISYPGGQYTPNNTLKSLLFLRGKVKSLPVNPPSTTISKPSTKPTGKSPDEIFKESEREVMEYESNRAENAKWDRKEYNDMTDALNDRMKTYNDWKEIERKVENNEIEPHIYKGNSAYNIKGWGDNFSLKEIKDEVAQRKDDVSEIENKLSDIKNKIIENYPNVAKEMFPNEKIEKLKFGDIVPYQEFFKSGLRRDQRLFTKKSSDILNGIRKTGEISQADRDWYAKEFGEDNTNYDIAYQRLRGSFPLTKEERNVLVNKHGEDWVLTREKRHKTHIKLVRENDKFGDVKPEDQWNGYGDSLSPTVRQQWQAKLEEFEDELQGTKGEDGIVGTTNDTNMGGPDGVSDARRLQYQRLFDEQVRISDQEGSGDHWKGVQVNTNFTGTKEFRLAEKHFNSYGYQVVPISRVDWGGAVNHDTKTAFLGEMSGDKYAYIMSHETAHILTKQGNTAALAVKNNINPNHPEVLKARSKRGWDLDHTKDEFAASIIGGMDENIDMLLGDQTENIKQAREAAGGENNIKTNTPEFKKWFGDSKVVDENGEPLVVYHAGKNRRNAFPSVTFWGADAGMVSSFGRDQGSATTPAYLNILNPYYANWEEIEYINENRDEIERIKNTGYDGIIEKSDDQDSWQFVTFSPTQIKSATANVGTYDINNPDIRYGDIIPASIKQSITDLTNKFQSNPQSTVPDEWVKSTLQPFLKTDNDFRFKDKYLGLPWWNAKRYPAWRRAFEIFGIERPEDRGRLMHSFSQIAEPFFKMDDNMRKAGKSREAINDAKDRIYRVIVTGDAQLGPYLKSLRAQYREMKDGPERNIIADKIAQIETDNRYSDKDLLSGIKDDRGQTVKLTQQEVEVYKAVRQSLDSMFESYSDHLNTQTFRNYRNQKWYSILAQAVGMDLTKEQTINIVGKGLNKAALLKSKSIQPNIQRIFARAEQAISETPDAEKLKAGELYGKLADKMTKEISELRSAISSLSGVTDPTELSKMAKDVFSAYLMVRPQTKKIKALRNLYKKQVAFFPRVREQGKYKLKVVQNIYDDEGNLTEQKQLFMKMFSTEKEGRDIYNEAMERFGKNGKLPKDITIPAPEQAIQTPEFAFQGVNDINMQKVLDDAIEGLKIRETYYNKDGESVNIQDHLRDLGFEAIAKQFQSRGFGRHMTHRQMNVVKGYQESGLEQVLFNYMSGMSGIMTKQISAGDFLEHMKTVKDPKMFEALAKYGRDQLRNETGMDKLSNKVRSFMFTWYLGGVLRPAILQFTQNFVTGIPQHALYLRNNKLKGWAEKDYSTAMKDLVTKNLTETEAKMEAQLYTDGITVDQYIREIQGSLGNQWAKGFEKWMNYLAVPFSRMEIFNRQSAALTRFRPAYKMAMEKVGKKIDGRTFTEEDAYNEAFASARTFVYDTHFAMGKANLPQLAQGEGMGIAVKTAYTFKSFMHNYVLLMTNDAREGNVKAIFHSLAYLAMFGGLMGLPFFKDMFEFIEKYFGYSPANEVRQLLRGMGGKTLEQFGMNGLPAMLGMNMSGSLAIGVPFMGEDSLQTIGGVYEGQRQKLVRAWDAFGRADYYRVAANLAPEFLRGPITAAQESQVGKEVFGTPGSATTTRGGLVYDKNGKPLSMTGYQAALKSIGFQPEEYSRERTMDATIKRQKAWVDGRKADIAETYKVMRLNKNPNAFKEMYRAVQELKQDIKDRDLTDLVPRVTVSKIIQSSRQIKSLQERKQERYKRAEL